MKGLMYGGVSALLITIAASSIGLPASARPSVTSGQSTLPVPLMMMVGDTSMSLNFSAPFIASSGIRGVDHFIRVAVVGMSLKDLLVSIPAQMENYDSVRVVNQNGQEIPAKISVDKKRVAVLFDQPVPQGTYLELLFTGVQMRGSGGDTLFYGVSAEREGIAGEIPVGTAGVHIPSRS